MKKRVLLIEKDEAISDILRYILEDEGYDVIISVTEQGMVEKVINDRPDLILLDIIKPTEEGTALCDELKNSPSTKHIPVIVLSTYPGIQSVNIGCADDIIGKPFGVADMIGVVEKHLPHSELF